MTAGPSASVTGYVLAGGQSSRMGRDKALIDSNGFTLLQRALNTLNAVCSHAYILSGPPNAERDAKLSRYAPLLPDVNPAHAGPVAGLLAALQHCPTPYACILAVDQPGIRADHLHLLLTAAMQGDAPAVCFRGATGQVDPLPAVLSVSLLTPVQQLWHAGEHRLLTAMQSAAASTRAAGLLALPLPAPAQTSPLINLNTPSDLESWRSTHAASNQSPSGASE